MASAMRILVTKQNAGVSEWASATRLLRRSAPRNDIRGHGMSLRAKRSNLTPIVGARADRTRHNCAKQSQFAVDRIDTNCCLGKGLRENWRIMPPKKQSQFVMAEDGGHSPPYTKG